MDGDMNSAAMSNGSLVTDAPDSFNITTAEDGSWNSSKTTKAANKTLCTTPDPFDEFAPPEGIEYIFVPLGVMIFVVILSVVVLIISRKRKLERLRHRLMPLYNFDSGEEGEDDWETELLDDGFGSRQRRVSNAIPP